MHDLACLLSKKYPSETFALFIKNKDNIINLCLSGSITIFCNKIFFCYNEKTGNRITRSQVYGNMKLYRTPET